MNEEFIAEMIARVIMHGVVRPCTIPTYLSQSTKVRAMKRMVESGYLERVSGQKYVPGKKLSLIMGISHWIKSSSS